MTKRSAVITINSFLPNVQDIIPYFPKKDIKVILNQFLNLMVDSLLKYHKIHLNRLGTFEIQKTKARMGRNPYTGEALKIKATNKIAFRAAAPLKEKILSKKKR